ncbi:MAG TPA: M13 family metallopeptidase [Candidatus Eremiobacteraceae bacterium]|nr:M13 family metallopeptidase [Candidatus Eremiobacteraceae bacterium]
MLNRRIFAGLCISVLSILAAFVILTGRNANAASDNSSWGFSTSNLDPTCKPCNDFYQFAMGGWIKSHPIPAEYPSWGSFLQLTDNNQKTLRAILENEQKSNPPAGTNGQKTGDFYLTCMDTAAIESAGIKPLAPDFSAIAAIKDRNSLLAEVAALHNQGVNVVFNFGSSQDLEDSTKVIGEADQGGLGLPDRDYYLREDDHSKQLRAGYVAHMTKMFQLAGDSPEQSAKEAQAVMTLETSLAKASSDNVEMRDPKSNYHKMTLAQLHQTTPGIAWESYFTAVGLPGMKEENLGQPKFFQELDHQFSATPVEDWKTYLRWHILHSYATVLSDAFLQENFSFFGKQLAGTTEIQPRWKRCVASVNRNLGEALGQVYVEKYFPPEAKAHAREMVSNLAAALRADIPTLAWMSPETKKAALEKLEAFNVKIGYPDKWRDYSHLKIDRSSYIENLRRGHAFETARDLAKIGKPVDRNEWDMTPPTVNAYYNDSMNEIVFPAGILQPPFYDPKADDAVNYGGMGAVIGHEITHGFDDKGSQFDAKGNLREWWTDTDRKNFVERSACVEKQFDAYEVEPGLHQKGALVLGESIADLGGITISYAAYEKSLEGKPRKEIDGFSPEQRFFLGWAQVWGGSERPEYARLQTQTNPHPLARFRGNGPLSNMPEFAKAFGCKKGDPMVREQSCKIW